MRKRYSEPLIVSVQDVIGVGLFTIKKVWDEPLSAQPYQYHSSSKKYFGSRPNVKIFRCSRFSTSPMVNKRSLEDSVQISRKKQKAGRHASEVVVNAQPEINSVLLDQLLWKKVSLPDRFEDAEGFFGLEEIDDVDVVRDTANRKVQYRVGKGNARKSTPNTHGY